MPFPIPPKPWSSEFRYFLVAVPDDRGFIRAVKGHFGELGNYWVWGEEGPEDDSNEAAQRMLEAIDETWRLIEMGWPDEVVDAIDEIEPLLRLIISAGQSDVACCDNVEPVDRTEPPPDDYPATPPATYGSSEPIASSDDWQDLTCGAAHLYVDSLKAKGQQMADVIAAGAVTIGIIAGLLGLLATGPAGPIILPLGYGTIAGILGGILALASGDALDDAAAEIEGARADIVCTVVSGSGSSLKGLLSGVINATAWTAFYQWIDYDSHVNSLRNGSAAGSDLPVDRRTDCDCNVSGYTFVSETSTPFSASKTPPACDIWTAVFDNCWLRDGGTYGGEVIVTGVVTVNIDAFTVHSNCAGDADLRVRVALTRSGDCSPLDQQPWVELYNNGSEPGGAKSLDLPFSLTQTPGQNTHLIVRTEVYMRAGAVTNVLPTVDVQSIIET